MTELDPRIRIRAPLRCDGVGSLDCAEDIQSGSRLAVRWLPLDANGAAAVRAVSGLPEHPVLPRVLSFGRVNSSAYLSMEFPDGKLLSTLTAELLSVDRVRQLGAEVASALAVLHAHGICHGELSCDSVLLVADRRPLLWDLPIVVANRMTDRRGEERMLAQLYRTAPCLSPERARGNPASEAADVYGLGAVMALALGSKPPEEMSAMAVLHRIASGQWRPSVAFNAPASLRTVVDRMLQPDPQMRPSAREVAEVLAAGVRTATVTEPEFPATDGKAASPAGATASSPITTPAPGVALNLKRTYSDRIPSAGWNLDSADVSTTLPVEPPAISPELGQPLATMPAAPEELTADVARLAVKQQLWPWLTVAAVSVAAIGGLSALLWMGPASPDEPAFTVMAPELVVVASPEPGAPERRAGELLEPLVGSAALLDDAVVIPAPVLMDESPAARPVSESARRVGAQAPSHPRAPTKLKAGNKPKALSQPPLPEPPDFGFLNADQGN